MAEISTQRYVYEFPDCNTQKDKLFNLCAPEGLEFRNLLFNEAESIDELVAEVFCGMSTYYIATQNSDFMKKICDSNTFIPDCSWCLEETISKKAIAIVLVCMKSLDIDIWVKPYIAIVAVSPKFQAKGLGTLILSKTLESIGSVLGPTIVHTHIRSDNIASIRTFQNLGFYEFIISD